MRTVELMQGRGQLTWQWQRRWGARGGQRCGREFANDVARAPNCCDQPIGAGGGQPLAQAVHEDVD